MFTLEFDHLDARRREPGSRKILVIDRAPKRSRALVGDLQAAGFSLYETDDCYAALRIAFEEAPGAVLVGQLSASVGKTDFCAALRRIAPRGETLILFLLREDAMLSRMRCISAGADDCVLGSFTADMLVDRLSSLADDRNDVAGRDILRHRGIVLDSRRLKVTCNGQTLRLPIRQLELLRIFLSRPDAVLTNEEILEMLGSADRKQARSVNRDVARLRALLALNGIDDLILTERGRGYVMRGAAQSA